MSFPVLCLTCVSKWVFLRVCPGPADGRSEGLRQAMSQHWDPGAAQPFLALQSILVAGWQGDARAVPQLRETDQCLMGFASSLSQRHLIQGFIWPSSCLVTGLGVVMRARVSPC